MKNPFPRLLNTAFIYIDIPADLVEEAKKSPNQAKTIAESEWAREIARAWCAPPEKEVLSSSEQQCVDAVASYLGQQVAHEMGLE